MKAKEVRSRFLEFFAARQHQVVPSSTLVPRDDPTLLFTNAGMNQFKGVFLGLEKRSYKRAVSVQKCMRVSGKHNDLEEVGRDARHHTFFEMLGNWSFGDYYKRDSILWGWEFLTQEMGLAAERLWASVYKDDDESFAIWRDKVGLPAERILRLGDVEAGDEENFWSMADTGPCGPCTEIHYDQGPALDCDHPDGCAIGVCDCDRWLELWNHVFMEFDRQADGSLQPLPMKSVDTGLGFERLVAVLQGQQSNYRTDLFTPMVERVAELCGRPAEGADRVSMQVIADHARAVAFTITDGAVPSNEGRGYVVRRILRRAARHGHLLGLDEPFLWRIAEVVIEQMGGAYPELAERRERTLAVIRKEEERFGRTLTAGLQVYADFKAAMQAAGRTQLSGGEAFKLHDTFGFPVDLTAVVAAEDGLTVDQEGFQACMARQRSQSGAERVFRAGIGPWHPLDPARDPAGFVSRFTGYDQLTGSAEAVAVRSAGHGEDGEPLSHLLLTETPFYGEAGGQVGDVGMITLQPSGRRLPVVTTGTTQEGPVPVVAMEVQELQDELARADRLEQEVDPQARLATMRHHTATHLLHAALREVLGDHVEQAGSEVSPRRLRFDFRHDQPVTEQQLGRIEAIVQDKILANRPVIRQEDMELAEARRRGAMALFGEKYGQKVRVIEIHGEAQTASGAPADAGPLFSLELCGGTHCRATGDIGPFRIVSESSVAAGVRRIEAVAGAVAQELAAQERRQLRALGGLLRADGGPLADQVQELLDDRRRLRKELAGFQQSSARDALAEAVAAPRQVAGLRVVTALVAAADKKAFLELGDHVRDKLGERGVVVLGAEFAGKATLLATVTPDLVKQKQVHAGELVKALAAGVGGRGGGKPQTAQAGLPDGQALAAALQAVEAAIEAQFAD